MKKLTKRFTAVCCAAALAVTCCVGASAASYSGSVAGVQWSCSLTRGTRSINAWTRAGSPPIYGDVKKVTVSCNYYKYGVEGIKNWSESVTYTNQGYVAEINKSWASNIVERTTSASSSHQVIVSSSGGSGSEAKDLSA